MVSANTLLAATTFAIFTQTSLSFPLPSQEITLSPGRSALVPLSSRSTSPSSSTIVRSMPYNPITDLDFERSDDASSQSAAASKYTDQNSPLSTVVVDQYNANTYGHVVPDPGEGVWQDWESQTQQLRLKSRSWLEKIFGSVET